jgi:hypothetical protein
MLGRLKNFAEIGFGELLLLAHDVGRDAFAVDRVRDENRLAFAAADPFAAECDVVDL